ncbi:hypothetical protein M947_02700 [Sulfurimonas hongkongensis]|uniref:DUF3373 domain-containing protein n=1 Tax=Sulfurimonas hongkongensis TaxID=1172190 RepID=T0L367_9BACT|nr:DUF3373 family protein [Sulfurimonas hongkongensis]EQB40263.1 hypothetical protein M947_02700 [Sulfurimonas hongkongensis]
MKKIIALSTVAFLSTALYADAAMQQQIDELKQKLEKMEKTQDRNIKKIGSVNALAAKDNIKFDVDFRTSYDNLQYETASGKKYENDGLYSNRLWLGMGYAPTDTMVFKGQLAYHKAFGASANNTVTGYPQRGSGFDTFDWVSNETLNDDKLRVREVYWLWMPTVGDFPMTVSVGRRPSTNGYLVNLREDDTSKSPMGHVINMEFDGASAGISLSKYVTGMNFKLCLGRGLTNAKSWANSADYATQVNMNSPTSPNYIEEDGALDTIDMAGFIFVPYDDGQYAVSTTWYRGFNVPGLTYGGQNANLSHIMALKTVGDMDGMAISAKVEGVGNEINDFLDETILFASFAASISRPDNITNHMTSTGVVSAASMLGSTDDETGTSIWVGAQMPNLTGGKFGLEYNHGSKHWRPFTYGEDTLIGSKLATRGDAYEAYWTQPLIDDVFSMQVRYTYIKYEYTGSNAFFGDGGAPMTMAEAQAAGMDPVEKAQDLRVYFRYRY